MKKLLILTMSLFLCFIVSCSDDDDSPSGPSANAPYIDSLSITTVSGAEPFTIYGKYFGDSKDNGYATLSNSGLTVITWSDKEIRVHCPYGAETGKVVVVVGGEQSNKVDLTVNGSFPAAINMVYISPGSFKMGASKMITSSENSPAHTVNITRGFYMSVYETTQKQMRQIGKDMTGTCRYQGDDRPVENITWFQAVQYCNEFSEIDGFEPCYDINGQTVTCDFNANGYRLPTDAEWEYACRAGTTGDYAGNIDDLGWTNDNSDIEATHDVGELNANKWSLYDMHGNVYEWCWDRFDADYFSYSPENDPRGPEDDSWPERVIRGGGFQSGNDYSMSAWRNGRQPGNSNYDRGFRMVRSGL